MKLLKVGRSNNCDIVLPSENVSSLHAEIIVLDSGEILLTDKNSANGTIVGNKRITPNSEVPVRRGDYVVLADTELPWSRVPQPENLSAFKTIVNIGSNYRNDIQLTSNFASRFHAMLKVSANGRKAYIRDLDSKNGVKVNGLKIKPNKDVQVRRGDIILCADQDITEEVKPYIPSAVHPALKWGGTAAAVLLILGLGGYLLSQVIGGGSCNYCHAEQTCKPLSQAADKRPGVVFLQTRYYYTVELENNPLPSEVWDGIIKFNDNSDLRIVSGTGFFIDEKGIIATNRHVACPWEYPKEEELKAIRQEYQKWLNNALAYKNVINTQDEYLEFRRSTLGKLIDDNTKNGAELNAMLSTIRNSSFKIVGVAYARYLAYPGRNYTHFDEMERCDFIADSKTTDKDVALLQLNKQVTPETCSIFPIKNFRLDQLKPQIDNLYTIGYPLGLLLGMDNTTKKLEPFIYDTKCSKQPSHFTFELQGMAVGGQSGSPVFDEYGHLVGMISESFNAGGIIQAVQANYIKELYNSEVDYYNSEK